MKRLVAILALGIALAPAQAGALELKLLGEPLRLDITESLFTSYHGDLGYLKSEEDRFNRKTDNYAFWDLLNRLNVDLAWGHWRLATRFDIAVYFGTPSGSCGSSLTTKASQQAGASLRFANAQAAAHTAQMEARRKAAAR